MPNTDFIPTTNEGKATLFERFRDAIGSFSGVLGLAPADLTAQAEDAGWFRYALNHTLNMRDSASQWVAYKSLLLNGDNTSGPANIPVTPPMPTPEPPNVDFGILTRFRDLCRRIKAAPGYNETIGEALGILGPDRTPQPLSTLAPDISLRTTGGQVEVIWNKDGMEAIEIQKDTGTGVWQLLAVDTRPNYIDTTPFPAPSAKWSYRAIYTEDSQRVGQWSNVAEITVGG